MKIARLGLGGGCYWCTEAVFQSLRGVQSVEQGFIGSDAPHDALSESVWLTYDDDVMSTSDLLEIHLRTHSSSSQHVLRDRYRSAIYYPVDYHRDDTPTPEQLKQCLLQLKQTLGESIVTVILPCKRFVSSAQRYKNYYRNNPEKPFCKTYIDPKLRLLREKYHQYLI